MSKNILSMCLSPESISYWTSDVADFENWSREQVIEYDDADSGEVRIMFDPEVSIYDNLTRAAQRIKGREGIKMPEKKILYIDSPKSLLIPEALFEPDAALEYLKLHNMTPAHGEQIDISTPLAKTVAVMATPQDALVALGEQMGSFMVASPMQYNLMRRPYALGSWHSVKKTLLVFTTDSSVYLSLFKTEEDGIKKLKYQNRFSCSATPDLIYYLNLISKEFAIKYSPIYIRGSLSRYEMEEINNYFRRAQCG